MKKGYYLNLLTKNATKNRTHCTMQKNSLWVTKLTGKISQNYDQNMTMAKKNTTKMQSSSLPKMKIGPKGDHFEQKVLFAT